MGFGVWGLGFKALARFRAQGSFDFPFPGLSTVYGLDHGGLGFKGAASKQLRLSYQMSVGTFPICHVSMF